MSKSSNMNSDRVSTTASEGRKSSKPIMEKKRRARINASLAELKSLLLEVIKKEGARHSKMEKADILEMAVKHLRQVQRQQYTSATGADPTLSDKYRLGYNECAQEVSRYLGATEEDDAELRAKLLNHLANCITNSDSASSSSSSPAPTVASPEPTSPSSSSSTSPHRASGGYGDLRSQQVSSSGAENAIGQSGIVSPVFTPVPVRAGFALTSAPGGGGSPALPHAFLLSAPSAEINNNITTLANNNVILSASPDAFAGFRNVSQHVTLATATPAQASFPAGHSVQKLIGELVMPPKGSGGEVAFVVPANHYIIYASPTPGLAAGAVPFAATTSTSTAVLLPLLGTGPGGGGLVALGAGMSPALLPQTSLSHVVATAAASLGAPVTWHQSSTPVYASSPSNSSVSPAHSSSSFSSPNGQQLSTSSSLTSSSPSSSSWSPSTSLDPSGVFASDTCLSTISPRSGLGLMSISDRPTVIASAQPLQLTTLHGKRFESTAGPSSSSFSTSSSSCASLLFPQPHAFPTQQALNPQPLNLSPRAFHGLALSAPSGLGQVADEVYGARPARGGLEDGTAVGGRTALMHSQLGKRRSPTPRDGPGDETEHGPWRPW